MWSLQSFYPSAKFPSIFSLFFPQSRCGFHKSCALTQITFLSSLIKIQWKMRPLRPLPSLAKFLLFLPYFHPNQKTVSKIGPHWYKEYFCQVSSKSNEKCAFCGLSLRQPSFSLFSLILASIKKRLRQKLRIDTKNILDKFNQNRIKNATSRPEQTHRHTEAVELIFGVLKRRPSLRSVNEHHTQRHTYQ